MTETNLEFPKSSPCKLERLFSDGHRGENFEVRDVDSNEANATITEDAPLGTPFLRGTNVARVFAKAISEQQKDSELSIQRLLNGVRRWKREGDTNEFIVSVPKSYGTWQLTPRESNVNKLVVLSEFIPGNNIPPNYLKSFEEDCGSRGRQVPASTFFQFARALCRCVQLLHNHGVIHSAIFPRNLLFTREIEDHSLSKEISLVGFGYAAASDTAIRQQNPLASDLTESDWLFRAPECRTLDTHSAYWLPSDIFSLGAIMYWQLVHTRNTMSPSDHLRWKSLLKNPPKDVNLLKDQISRNLRHYCSGIYEENENITKILDTCLRYNPEHRFTCVEELLESLSIAEKATGDVRTGKPHLPNDNKYSNSLNLHEKEEDEDGETEERGLALLDRIKGLLSNQPVSYFREHIDAEIDRVHQLALKCSQGKFSHFEVYGGRDNIVNSLCRMLGSSPRNNTYLTVTLPNYWSDTNLGSNGRFLTMNKHMARRELKVQRLFLVSKTFHELTSTEQQVLEWQYRAQDELYRESASNGANFDVRVLKVEEEDISSFEALGLTVAYLGPESLENLARMSPEDAKQISNRNILKETVCLNFFSTASAKWCYNKAVLERHITKLRYWRPLRDLHKFGEGIKRLNDQWNDAITLRRYIFGSTINSFIDLEGAEVGSRDLCSTIDLILEDGETS